MGPHTWSRQVLDVDTFPLDMLGEAKKQESLRKVIRLCP